MILNDFSKRYRIFTHEKPERSNGILVSPHCFNYIGQRFPISHEHVVFWDGKEFYTGSRIYDIEEVSKGND